MSFLFIFILGDYIKYRAVDEEYPGWNVVSYSQICLIKAVL